MRKCKIFFTAFILLMTLFILSVEVSAADTTIKEGRFDYEVVDGEAIIRRVGSSGIKNLVIPETLGGYPVTEIYMEKYASDIDSSVTAVTLPKTIKKLGNINKNGEFKQVYVDNLETWLNINLGVYPSRYFNEAVLYVDGKAVTDVVVPDSVTEIGHYIFCMESFESVTFSESIQSVSTYAFDSSSLKKVYVPDLETWFRISNICTYTDPEIYINNEKPVDIVIPENVDTIPNYAFEDFYLKSITFTTPIKEFGYYWLSPHYMVDAFYVDSFETWMNFNFEDYPLDHAKCLYIDGEAVAGDYVFPETCTRISNLAFYNYKALKSITLHAGIEHIGDHAFSGPGIENVYVDSLETWFKICDNIYKSNGQATYKANPMYSAKNLYVDGELLVDLVIPETITEIPVYGLYSIDTIKSVTLHSGIEYIGEYAFDGTGVENIYIDSLESWFRICDNIYKDNSGATHFANPMCYAKNLYVAGELLVDLVIPETVTEIPAYGLYNIKSIKSVTFHSGITTVHNHSFNSCTNIKEVYVPDIGTYARVGAVNQSSTLDTIYVDGEPLVNLVVPEGVTELPAKIFKNYKKLESATISGSVKSIGDSAFEGCTNLKTITMAYGIESIGQKCFENCRTLEAVNIDSIATLVNIKFKDMSSNPVTLAKNLYVGGEIAADIVVPEGVTVINNYAFAGCNTFKTLVLPSSLKKIGVNIFTDESLEKVYVPSIDMWLGLELEDKTSNPMAYAEELYVNNELFEELRMPEGITVVKKYAFYGCDSLRRIIITEDPIALRAYAFAECSDFGIYVNSVSDWLNVTFGENNISNAYCNPLYYGANLYVNGEIATEIVIPESCKFIPSYAFVNCKSITKITIPATTSMGHLPFSNNNLKEIVVGSLTEKLEPTAVVGFDEISSSTVEKITFGYGVKKIGDKAFNNCSELKEVIFYPGIMSIGKNAFSKTGITSVSIPSSVTSVGDYAFSKCDSLETVILGDNDEKVFYKTAIGNYVFSECDKLESVIFNSGVCRVGKRSFFKSDNIKDVYINDLKAYFAIGFDFNDMQCKTGSNPVSYAENVYVEGEIAKNIVIPEGVYRICEFAFDNCKTLESVTFPSTLEYIYDRAFQGCSNLKNVELPESLIYVGDGAFMGCSSFTEISIGGNIVSVGFDVFSGCNNIKLVYMYPELIQIGAYAFGENHNIELVLYSGTEEAWNELLEQNKNTGLEEVAVFFRYRPGTMYAPDYIEAAQTTDSITVTWSKINGVTGYRLYMKNDKNWKTIETLKDTTYKVKGLKAGTKYSFAVKAYISSGAFVLWSTEYTTIDTATKAVKPSKVTAVKSKDKVELTWSASPGATGYCVYQKSGNSWKEVLNTGKTKHTFDGAKASGKYTYYVQPYIETESDVIWSDRTQVTAFDKTVKPAKLTAKQTITTITLSWSKVTGATGYRVYKYNSKTKKYEYLKSTTGTSLKIIDLKSGTKYKFKIRAYVKNSGTVYGQYSSVLETSTRTKTPSITDIYSKAKGKAVVKWSNVTGESGFQLYYATSKDGTYKKVKSYEANKLAGSKTKLKSGKKYYFKVRAYKKTSSGTVYSSWSAVKSVRVK